MTPTETIEQVETTAHAFHRATDKVADTATEAIDRVSGGVHRAVNLTADAAAAAAERVQRTQTATLESARGMVRTRPLGWVVGALIAGLMLGRAFRS